MTPERSLGSGGELRPLLLRFDEGEPAAIGSVEFWDLLASAWEEPPDQHGFVRVVWGEGGADVYAGRVGEPQDSVMINHFGGDEIMDLIVELARKADAVIIGPDLPPVLTRAEQRALVPSDIGVGDPVLVATGRDLSRAIADA